MVGGMDTTPTKTDPIMSHGEFFARGWADEFPTLAELHAARHYWPLLPTWDDYLADSADWLAVAARDGQVHGDESLRAQVETDWLHIVDTFGYEPHIWERGQSADEWTWQGVAIFGRVLAIDPDHPDAPDWIDSLTDDLVRSREHGLPLDEEAYSERESEAWNEYVPIAWDEEISDALRARELTEDEAELLEADESLPFELCAGLHYWGGFTGEYSPRLLEILAQIGQLVEGGAQ